MCHLPHNVGDANSPPPTLCMYVRLTYKTSLIMWQLNCTAHLHNPGVASPTMVKFARLQRRENQVFFHSDTMKDVWLFGSMCGCQPGDSRIQSETQRGKKDILNAAFSIQLEYVISYRVIMESKPQSVSCCGIFAGRPRHLTGGLSFRP